MMDSTLLGSIVGFLGAALTQWLTSRSPGTAGTNGSVVAEGEVSGGGDETPFEPVELPFRYRFLDFYRGLIRPGLTTGFFVAWLAVKAVILYFALRQSPAVSLPSVFWTEDDSVLFATIISFWFGSRVGVRFRR